MSHLILANSAVPGSHVGARAGCQTRRQVMSRVMLRGLQGPAVAAASRRRRRRRRRGAERTRGWWRGPTTVHGPAGRAAMTRFTPPHRSASSALVDGTLVTEPRDAKPSSAASAPAGPDGRAPGEHFCTGFSVVARATNDPPHPSAPSRWFLHRYSTRTRPVTRASRECYPFRH